jgi:hypothetical protein
LRLKNLLFSCCWMDGWRSAAGMLLALPPKGAGSCFRSDSCAHLIIRSEKNVNKASQGVCTVMIKFHFASRLSLEAKLFGVLEGNGSTKLLSLNISVFNSLIQAFAFGRHAISAFAKTQLVD